MIQLIIDGIIAALLGEFHNTKVYTEQVKQGLQEPCFMIQCINPANELFLGNRYYRTNLFSVQYIPKSGTDAKAECYGVLDRLFLALEYITVGGDLTRGTGMRGEFVDGVLMFLVSYNMFIRIEPVTTLMEDLTIENQTK